MKRAAAYKRSLDRLAALLRREELTAKEIAVRLKVSKPAVYSQLRALAQRGDSLWTTRKRWVGKPGPAATAYGVR